MTTSQTQNALVELMQMVGNMPQPQVASTMNNVPQTHQMARKSMQPPADLKAHFNLHLQQQAQQKQQNGFKPMKPLERRTAAIKPPKTVMNGTPLMNPLANGALNPMLNGLGAMPNGQLMDPRLFFPAALMTPNGTPKLNGTMPTALQMQQMFSPSLPTTCAPLQYPQMTNEQMLTAMSMGAWPVDPTAAMMQQPALLNKLYSDYLTACQQQQYIHTLMMQSAQNNAIKVNSMCSYACNR
jgi:hypothetical protein